MSKIFGLICTDHIQIIIKPFSNEIALSHKGLNDPNED